NDPPDRLLPFEPVHEKGPQGVPLEDVEATVFSSPRVDLKRLLPVLGDLDLGLEKRHLGAARRDLGVLWVEPDLPDAVRAFPHRGELLEVAERRDCPGGVATDEALHRRTILL